MSTFPFWMVHCGIWNKCILRFMLLAYSNPGHQITQTLLSPVHYLLSLIHGHSDLLVQTGDVGTYFCYYDLQWIQQTTHDFAEIKHEHLYSLADRYFKIIYFIKLINGWENYKLFSQTPVNLIYSWVTKWPMNGVAWRVFGNMCLSISQWHFFPALKFPSQR